MLHCSRIKWYQWSFGTSLLPAEININAIIYLLTSRYLLSKESNVDSLVYKYFPFRLSSLNLRLIIVYVKSSCFTCKVYFMASGNITTPNIKANQWIFSINSCTIDNLIPVTSASIISIFWQHHNTFYTTILATFHAWQVGSEMIPIFPEISYRAHVIFPPST